MAWDEWERLKASAAERNATGTRLNGVPVDHVAEGDLHVSQTDLAAVGNEAHTLYERLRKEGRVAVPTTDRAAGDLSGQGFALGGALKHVSNRWEKQLGSLLDACAHISNHMDVSGRIHQDDDHWIRRSMSSINTLDQGFDESYAPAGAKNPAYAEKDAKGKDGN
ncbi:hypothetical protein GCM10010387_47910 [Streptomyces inusitatus]|uniref:AG1 protein n=1 Tax=Streptomyces inusitatus TaxID=68221 RepID=A0A918QIP7_9ACTN|nr:hypothetical protein [Streptomyces inusitatus]GGZ47956.1 hypothetical protein GCM10010387_47910 [Streptomyces inusitatus]